MTRPELNIIEYVVPLGYPMATIFNHYDPSPMPAKSWPDRGILGSLRGFVEAEVANHYKTNQTIRRCRDPLSARLLSRVLRPSMLRVVILLNLLAVAIPLDATNAYDAIPLWMRPLPATTAELREHLQNTNAYFLVLQVGLIALIFPIAIALVSILAQRSHVSSPNAHIQIYYDEARAWPVGASGIAFAGVLSFQLLSQAIAALPIAPLTMNLGIELLAREFMLAVVNFVWLVCNLIGIWHFLKVSLQFVNPADRERIRERFTAWRSMPQHLRKDWFLVAYLDSGRLLLPESEADDGPRVLFGSFGKIVGDDEIRKRVRQNQALTDVWGRPLRLVLRRWWRRSHVEASDGRFAGLTPSAALGFLPRPGALVSGSVAICRRSGGVEFSAIERWIIRRCFRFQKAEFKELPSPRTILEELADEALGQMENLAIIGFTDALSSMAKYHQFLISAHTRSDPVGEAGNVPTVGNAWEMTPDDWVVAYYRIVERAVKLLDREERFVKTTAYLPRWLLPKDLTRADAGTVTRLLDLARTVVVRLEDWAAERALRAEQKPSIAPAELNLSALDHRRYADTLRAVVGAWESVLSLTSSYFRWADGPQSAAAEWDRLRVAWPFLWHHLKATAYFVAISVWNGDREGLGQYLDCLLRWPDHLAHDLERDYFLQKEFLSCDVLDMEWTRVEVDLAPLRPVDMYDLRPQGVFVGILENAWRDVLWIVAGIILGWLADGKTSPALTQLALERIRAGEPIDDQGFYGRPLRGRQENEFTRLFQSLVRMQLSGDPWSDRGYAAYLNGLVQFLDLMSERDVVPGRVFRPTTRHDLNDLQMLLVALLLLVTDLQAIEQMDENLIDGVEAGYGDDGLTTLQSYLERLSSHLRDEASRTYITRIVGIISERAELENKCRTLLDYARRMSQIAGRRAKERR